MSITAIDNFEFDVDLLINEYNIVSPHLYHLRSQNILIDEYNKFIFPEVYKTPVDHPDFLATKHFKLIEYYNRVHEVIKKMPYTQEIIERVKLLYNFSDVIYRMVLPGKAYMWHTDNNWSESDHNYHIPLITNVNCNFMYMDKIYPMPVGKLYKCMTNKLHTFRNDGSDARIHLTFEKMKKINGDGFTKRTFDNN